MTPSEYLKQMHRLARARDLTGILAFTDEHLTEEMLDAMTPHERRRVHSVLHVAELSTGGGALGPPTGIPIDDLEDEALAEATSGDSAVPVRRS